MVGILMDMPSSCNKCPLCTMSTICFDPDAPVADDYYYCCLIWNTVIYDSNNLDKGNKRHEDCPLIDLGGNPYLQ